MFLSVCAYVYKFLHVSLCVCCQRLTLGPLLLYTLVFETESLAESSRSYQFGKIVDRQAPGIP